MPDDNQFLPDDDDQVQPPVNDGGSLRKFAEDQKKRADALEKQLRDVQTSLARRDAESVFNELGINEKVRKFYTGDLTKDAISEWWKENAEVFGVDPGVGNDPTLNDAQQQHQQDIQNVQQAAQLGQDRSGAVSRETMAEARKGLLSQGRDVTDLNAALAKMGVPDLPFMAPQF
jgi:hypothetical protein